MRKLNLRVVLFLTLIFALSFGLPFLAFNQMLTNKHEKDDAPIRMAVAFVNEDEGATFNNQEVVFGDEFANSIQKDDEHDWYVVSRGVAENGLDRNAYDMMIVIPNNFSEKAVSIDLEEPEQISLHYKINTSGHEGVRAEAEKTANRLLNEFNQRIIDVYFASIIGNLQEAQDHVGEIVKKEELYTNTYKDSINHPLSDYTNQFQRVRDQTGRSVDHFSSLEDILKGNENNINADVRNNKDSLVRLNNLPRTPKDETSFPMPFSDQFEPFEPPSRNINDVGLDDSQQFKQLQAENDAYNERFSHKDSDKQTHVASVASNDTNGIEAYLNQMNQQVNQIESSIDESIHRDIRPEVEKRLSDSFQEVFDGQDIYIRSLFKDLDRNAHKKIQSQIEQVPSLNVNDINGSGLPKDTTNQLKNAIFVTNKYNQEFSFSPGAPNKSNLLSHQIHQIKNELATTGVTITDSVHISEDQDADQTFYLTVPNEFEVTSLSLKMPNKQEKSYKQHQKIELPAMSKGDFHVRANIKLKDTNQTIDVFKPVTWEWKLEPKEMKNKGSTSTTKKIASLSLHENEGNNNHPVEFRDQNEQGIIVKQMNNNPDKTTETGEENKSSDSIEGNEESSDPDGGREDGDPAENNEDDGRGND
ncbi:MAG TPA: type VII secretion protein EsaA, partial [Bacillota bacterium]|nr:type VII secretion protein EsaA [Bacillota bacterium]